ncbi:MAG: hypothetical protein GY953_09220, partial [bacterium]|nr:hypothetical protein [bacterium]
MRIAIGQTNTTVGDLAGNVDLMAGMAAKAAEQGAELVVFPELALTGYPPRDLLEKPSFFEQAELEEKRLAEETAGLSTRLVFGAIRRSHSKTGKPALNIAAVMERGQVVFEQTKMLLPTYDVFDEERYFVAAERQKLCTAGLTPMALTVCEDAWNDKQFWERRLYRRDPVEELVHEGASLLVTINASPYHMGKRELRREIFAAAARRHGVPVIYVNQVGGNDQLVFDGSSFAMNRDGEVIAGVPGIAKYRGKKEGLTCEPFETNERGEFPLRSDGRLV